MSEFAVVDKRIQLSTERAERLGHLAQAQEISEDLVVEKALDIFFSLTELFDGSVERQGWSFLSKSSLQRIWDNEDDARYDNWRELYGLPKG